MKLPRLHWLDVLLVFVPAAVILHAVHAPALAVFACSCLAIIPLAGWMGRATEGLASKLGAGAGGLMNATFGNAAEHSSAILVALKNRMDLALHIGIGSSIQIALLVAPVLVLLGRAMGQPMDLLFTGFEVVTVGLAALVLNMIASDGESNWMEGVLLLAVYVIFGIAFYFLPG